MYFAKKNEECIMGLGWQELLLIFLFVLLFFGARKIPEIARSLGKATREFKKAKDNFIKESEEMIDAAEKCADKEAEKEEKKEAAAKKDKSGKDIDGLS
jgi:sec-independent protein translocase protein TatA